METSSPVVARKLRAESLMTYFLRRLLREKPLGVAGAVIVLALLLVAAFAGFLAPYGLNEIILPDRFMSPSARHLLGTDNLGRDMLSRIIYGARISLYVGMGAAGLDAILCTIIGTVSGFAGGKIDITIQRFVDAFMCFPPLLLYLTIMSLMGGGIVQVILVLGVTGGISGSRIIRSAVISLKTNIYVEAAKTIGATPARVALNHIIPNVMPTVIIVFSITIGYMILAEATLSFLGFGIPPPEPSWGGMLSGRGREYMLIAPWMALWPGLALAVVVYGVNMLGDAIRDILDPRLRGR